MGDDNWPPLAPIRTSISSACHLHICNTTCKSSNLEEGHSLQDWQGAACSISHSSSEPASTSSCTACSAAAPFDRRTCSPSEPNPIQAANTNLITPSSGCHTSKKSCIDSFCCFFPTEQASSRRLHRRCTPTCMRKTGPVRRSTAFLFPASGFQSFYSSPTGKAAQLSGAFPRTLSASKLQHYASPRTPGKLQQFSSPRTPGSGDLHCLSSAPRTPASGKVQHFSGAIPSPRTPFGSIAASPFSASRRKSSFTLFMPPATLDKRKGTAEQLDEPTSPHVTCIGRVRRKNHCRKPDQKDIFNPQLHRKNGTNSNRPLPAAGPGPSPCHVSISSHFEAFTEPSATEACNQKFGKYQLHNLHKIYDIGDESGDANAPDQAALDCIQGDDSIPIANGSIKNLIHLDSQNHDTNSPLTNKN